VTVSPESVSSVKSGAGSPSRSIATSKTRRAIGIVRVSRMGDREGETFVSVPDQRERIAAACKREGYTLLDTFEETDVSGGAELALRPKLSRAIAMIEAGEADIIVVAFFDRLVRSLAVQQELLARVEAAGGTVLAVDLGEVRADTASRWLNSTLLGAVAEHQRRVTAERTSEAKRRAVARGVAPFPNVPPWLRRGDGEKLELDPKAAPVVREAIRLRIEGRTIAQVRAYLGKHGIRRSYHGVQALLRSRMLLGELRFGETFNPDAFPALIDPETWQRLQRVFVSRGRRPKSDRLLARLGVLRCGTCGARMVVGSQTQGEKRWGFYRCPPVGDCPQRVAISSEVAELRISEAVQELLAGIEGRASVEGGVNEAADELTRRQEALDAAIRTFAGLEDEQAARERLQELRAARDQARERHDDLAAASAPAITVGAGDWDLLTLDERRALIRALIAKASVSPGRGADRITIEPRVE
jgi:site-specific DNA recombinase